jgi:hypothetical protein
VFCVTPHTHTNELRLLANYTNGEGDLTQHQKLGSLLPMLPSRLLMRRPRVLARSMHAPNGLDAPEFQLERALRHNLNSPHTRVGRDLVRNA